jgi:large subunit ribosomal protein L21
MKNIAIIHTGGKQYLVEEGTVLKVEKLSRANAKSPMKPGDAIEFDKVLLTDDGAKTTIGKPYVKGAVVKAELIEESRYPTVTVIKYRQKSRYFKKRGHRQPYAKVKITKVA